MNPARSILATALAVTFAGPLAAQDTGHFIIRLGRDTTSVESYTRTANHIEVDQVGRAPRVLRRRVVLDLGASGGTTGATAAVSLPTAVAGAPPLQQFEVTITGDSLFMQARRDTVTQRVRIGAPAGTVVFVGSAPWSMYEELVRRLMSGKTDSLRATAYALGGANLTWLVVRKRGRDSVDVQTENDLYRVHVDAAGKILHVRPIRGTQQVSVERVSNLDLATVAASFAAREQAGAGLGTLSPRDTVRAAVGGAALTIDYSRPSKRGRVIFGQVVPWGELWRTGANAATQFRTDKDLEIGGKTLPAGFYTLWTIPSPNGWKLIINSETGVAGTAHKADKDLMTLDMTTSTLPQPVERFTIAIAPSEKGGTLNMEWDSTRASIPFAVKQ